MSYLSDEDYAFIYNRVPRICVDMLIINSKGEVLLTKRSIEPYKDHWHFPGGRIKFKETAFEAIKRIMKGELGKVLDAKVNMIGFCEFLEEVQDDNPRHSISLVHEVILTNDDDDIMLDENAKEFAFFSELPNPIIPPQHEFLIKQGWS